MTTPTTPTPNRPAPPLGNYPAPAEPAAVNPHWPLMPYDWTPVYTETMSAADQHPLFTETVAAVGTVA